MKATQPGAAGLDAGERGGVHAHSCVRVSVCMRVSQLYLQGPSHTPRCLFEENSACGCRVK